MKKSILMSSGGAVVRYTEQLKKLKDNDDFEVIAFAGNYNFCIQELNIFPDYYLFLDPWASILGLKHLAESVKLSKEIVKTKIVFLDPLHTKLNYEEYIQWMGTTPLGRTNTPGYEDFGGFDELHRLYNELKDSGNVIDLPCFTLKHIFNNKSNYSNDVLDVLKNFEQRFNLNEVIIKNQLDPTFNEDKLTSAALPILQKLGIKEVFLVGWDCMGGRYSCKKDKYSIARYPEKAAADAADGEYFLSPEANRGLREAKISVSKYLPLYNKHINCTNLVEDKYTFLNKFIDYKPIDEVIK